MRSLDHRSHAKKPESGLFSDWIGNNTDDLRCSNWPKCRHPFSLRSCPLPIISLCLSREEGMIHFFVGSHVKKPESGLFSDWIGNNMDDLLLFQLAKMPSSISC